MHAETLLHDLTDSPSCAKARICLTLKGVAFRRLTLTLRGLRRLRLLNPLGQVPVLEHDGRVLADSTAIVRYLEERFPDPPLLPPEPAARAYCELVEDWADGTLAFVVGAVRWLNPANRQAAVGLTARELGGGPLVGWALAARLRLRYRAAGYSTAALGHFEERLGAELRTLAALLEQRAFLLGRTLTLADVAVFAQLAPLRHFAEAALLDAHPLVARWLERVAALPAVAVAVAA
jgi:glutathione S-transferase